MLNLDTHILLYALSGDLTSHEKNLLSSQQWSISAMVLWEIVKLAQLKRMIWISIPETSGGFWRPSMCGR